MSLASRVRMFCHIPDGKVLCVTAQTANRNPSSVIHSTDSTPVVVQMG